MIILKNNNFLYFGSFGLFILIKFETGFFKVGVVCVTAII